jgi:hypothetical protein
MFSVYLRHQIDVFHLDERANSRMKANLRSSMQRIIKGYFAQLMQERAGKNWLLGGLSDIVSSMCRVLLRLVNRIFRIFSSVFGGDSSNFT